MEISRFGCSFLLLTLCLLILVSGRRAYGQKEETRESLVDSNGKCMKDGSFFNDCNRCRCKKDRSPSCTMKACGSIFYDDKIRYSCEPGEEWKPHECFKCQCHPSGFPICTPSDEDVCYHKEKRKRSTQQNKMDQQGRCKPGDKWQLDECNGCTCTHTGYASCTLNDCKQKKRAKRSASIGKPLDMKKREARPWRVQGGSGNECRAGHSWKENCNSCFCSERGIAMCTDMPCPTPPSSPKK